MYQKSGVIHTVQVYQKLGVVQKFVVHHRKVERREECSVSYSLSSSKTRSVSILMSSLERVSVSGALRIF